MKLKKIISPTCNVKIMPRISIVTTGEPVGMGLGSRKSFEFTCFSSNDSRMKRLFSGRGNALDDEVRWTPCIPWCTIDLNEDTRCDRTSLSLSPEPKGRGRDCVRWNSVLRERRPLMKIDYPSGPLLTPMRVKSSCTYVYLLASSGGATALTMAIRVPGYIR